MVKKAAKKELVKEKKKPGRKKKPIYIYKTNTGHKLTVREAKFIDLYIETSNARQSVIQAGYNTKAPGQYGNNLLAKGYIAEEIQHRLEQLESTKIASAEEILKYFTGVMRGEVKDQFGLDAPLGERTKAAQELAKRMIDVANKVSGKAQAEVTVKLDWEGFDSEDDEEDDSGE